jgi:hypothetical protein
MWDRGIAEVTSSLAWGTTTAWVRFRYRCGARHWPDARVDPVPCRHPACPLGGVVPDGSPAHGLTLEVAMVTLSRGIYRRRPKDLEADGLNPDPPVHRSPVGPEDRTQGEKEA